MHDTLGFSGIFFSLMAVVMMMGFAILNLQMSLAKSKLKMVPVRIRARDPRALLSRR